jgi:hypothetical protein
MIIGVHLDRQPHLPEVVNAKNDLAPLLGPGKRWEHHARQNPDDGDDHQKFNEGETRARQPGDPAAGDWESWTLNLHVLRVTFVFTRVKQIYASEVALTYRPTFLALTQ